MQALGVILHKLPISIIEHLGPVSISAIIGMSLSFTFTIAESYLIPVHHVLRRDGQVIGILDLMDRMRQDLCCHMLCKVLGPGQTTLFFTRFFTRQKIEEKVEPFGHLVE